MALESEVSADGRSVGSARVGALEGRLVRCRVTDEQIRLRERARRRDRLGPVLRLRVGHVVRLERFEPIAQRGDLLSEPVGLDLRCLTRTSFRLEFVH